MKRTPKAHTELKSRTALSSQERELLVHRLKRIHAASITAQLALREQDAEYDREIADVLRTSICDPLADQIEALAQTETTA